MKHKFYITTTALLILFGLVSTSCDDNTGSSCSQGSVECKCYPNSTCNYGLTCSQENVCKGLISCDTCTAQTRECITGEITVACGECLEGYHDVDGSCLDDNECDPYTCNGHGTCDATSGTPLCTCDSGYIGDNCENCNLNAGYHLGADQLTCTTNLCDPSPCTGDHQVCSNGICSCQAGYCHIDDTCIAHGEVDPWQKCNVCDAFSDTSDWSIAPFGTICRESDGECDGAEVCDGASADCPLQHFKNFATPCGSSENSICNRPDSCDGMGSCAPNFTGTQIMCRAPQSTCDATDFCNGVGGCIDEIQPAQSPCNDQNDCTFNDMCNGIGSDLSSCSGTIYGCNGQGTCNNHDNLCTCEAAYSGDNCESCASFYQDMDEDGICTISCFNANAPNCLLFGLICSHESGIASCMTPLFTPVPGGVFDMGSPSNEQGRDSDEVAHQVRISSGIEMMQTEVTQSLWNDIASLQGWATSPSYNEDCENCPVERINWYEALAFANALSTSLNLPECYRLTGCSGTIGGGCTMKTCNGDYYCESVTLTSPIITNCSGYRLPTEAEWEFAYRAKSETPFYPSTGNDGNIIDLDCSDANLDRIAWYCGNSNLTTHEVGGKSANSFNLYDMAGNISEWTWDKYLAPYETLNTTDPSGPEFGINRVVRGGNFQTKASSNRASSRQDIHPTERSSALGLRLVRGLDPDRDDVDTFFDNCPSHSNADQNDYDNDTKGDPCDDWILIPPGTYVKGSPDGINCPPNDPTCVLVPDAESFRESSEIQHMVTLTYPIEMMSQELTFAMWNVLAAFDSSLGSIQESHNIGYACGELCPYFTSAPEDLFKAANVLSKMEGLPECYILRNADKMALGDHNTWDIDFYQTPYDCPGYRLPTDVEWEYAARAGSNSAFYPAPPFTDGQITVSSTALSEPNLNTIAWYSPNSSSAESMNMPPEFCDTQSPCSLHAGGQKLPNSFYLYDMLGNVNEVVWPSSYIPDGNSVIDPGAAVAVTQDAQVYTKGGAFTSDLSKLRAAYKTPYSMNSFLGARFVRTLDADNDGVNAYEDNCPHVFNPGQEDTDNDGFGNACDNCTSIPNLLQLDTDAGEQNAISAMASSQSSSRPANNATGASSCFASAGCCSGSWSPDPSETTPQWIELTFNIAHSQGIKIREACTPGFVTSIDLIEANGTVHSDWWVGTDMTDWENTSSRTGPVWFEINWYPTPFKVQKVRIHTTAPDGFEIESVTMLSTDWTGDFCDQCPNNYILDFCF
jgi:formylglycine-generating enzyme required for sulfatase activity